MSDFDPTVVKGIGAARRQSLIEAGMDCWEAVAAAAERDIAALPRFRAVDAKALRRHALKMMRNAKAEAALSAAVPTPAPAEPAPAAVSPPAAPPVAEVPETKAARRSAKITTWIERLRAQAAELELLRAGADSSLAAEAKALLRQIETVIDAAAKALKSGKAQKKPLRALKRVARQADAWAASSRTGSAALRSLAHGEHVVGIDLGGTNVEVAIVDRAGKIVSRAKRPTGEIDLAGVVALIDEAIREAATAAGVAVDNIRAIGIGAPGSIDFTCGEVVFAPNLGWHNVPLQKALEDRLSIPARLDNDVNIGTLGEFVLGAGRGARDVVGIFWGTGIGGGIVVGGELLRGADGMAGEVGHICIVPDGPVCGCGRRGCLEAVASRTAIRARLVEAVQAGTPTVITDLVTDFSRIKSSALAKALAAGDKLVVRLLSEAAVAMGVGVANCINLLAPERVILGGGVMESLGGQLLDQVRASAADHIFSADHRKVQIVPSLLGDDAGVLGGAVLAAQSLARTD